MKRPFVLVAALAGVSAFAEDLVITETGTTTLPSPVTYGQLVNQVGSGDVTFDQSSVAVDEAHENSFVGFDAVTGARTFFTGGYWDFGSGAFFTETGTTPSDRLTVFGGGAVVTNIGRTVLGGVQEGCRNRLDVLGNAAVWMDTLVLGKRVGSQDNSCYVTDGGKLTLGTLDLSDSTRDLALYQSGNLLVVSNADSRLTVTGMTSVAREVTDDVSGTTVGGNTLLITDGARAKLAGLQVNCGITHGVSNKVIVSKNAVLLTDSCAVGNRWSVGSPAGNRDTFAVLDGASYTNAGSFVFGYAGSDEATALGETLIVSNATFVTKNMGKNGSGVAYALMRSAESLVRISGAQSVFSITDYTGASYQRPLFSRSNSRLILEDGAKLKLWNYGYTYQSYGAMRNVVTVRRNAALTSACDALVVGDFSGKNYPGRYNRLEVLDGGSVSVKYLRCVQNDTDVVVSNATLTVTGYNPSAAGTTDGSTARALTVGNGFINGSTHVGSGTNCTLRLQGNSPLVQAKNGGLSVSSGSQIIWELPPEGYAATPIVTTGGDSGASICLAEGSLLKVEGIRGVRRRAMRLPAGAVRYTLLTGRSLTVGADVIANSNALLPHDCAFSVVGNSIVLDVGTVGMMLFVR